MGNLTELSEFTKILVEKSIITKVPKKVENWIKISNPTYSLQKWELKLEKS